MARHTPWGKAQQSVQIVQGMTLVSTAGHGGIMVTEKAAKDWLSEAARECGMRYSGYLCYEEDCDINIVIYDAKPLWETFGSALPGLLAKPMGEVLKRIKRSISGYRPEYLLAIGEQPDPQGYAIYTGRREAERLYREKDPNHMVTCWGSWDTLIPGVVRVATADGTMHFVTEKSYQRVRTDDATTFTMPLNECELVDCVPALVDRLVPYGLHLESNYRPAIDRRTEEAIKEEQGDFYGPRGKFNASLKSSADALYRKLQDEAQYTSQDAAAIIRDQLVELRWKIDPAFWGCQIFV